MISANGLRLLRVLFFSKQEAIQLNSRYCYNRLLKYADANSLAEANMLANADPWESVLKKWPDAV